MLSPQFKIYLKICKRFVFRLKNCLRVLGSYYFPLWLRSRICFFQDWNRKRVYNFCLVCNLGYIPADSAYSTLLISMLHKIKCNLSMPASNVLRQNLQLIFYWLVNQWLAKLELSCCFNEWSSWCWRSSYLVWLNQSYNFIVLVQYIYTRAKLVKLSQASTV